MPRVSTANAVIAAIVVVRLLVPLAIPRWPLLIVVALLADAFDNTFLRLFTEVDLGPDGPYQSFDKALDIYYLAIAYETTLRNWTSLAAIRVARFLFYYRLVGVLVFELSGWRGALLLFPNTFEFFFIAYELIRVRFDPARRPAHFWVWLAAGLWILVKLPQEYWIHVAQLDFTDAVADHPWFGVLCAVGLLGLAAVFWWVVRPRLPAPDHPARFAADPVTFTGRSRHIVEPALLLGLMSIIFAEILTAVTLTALEVAIGVAAIVAIGALLAGRLPFVARLALNLALVYVGSRLLSDADDFPLATGLFFALLITLLTWLYETYRPVHDARFAGG